MGMGCVRHRKNGWTALQRAGSSMKAPGLMPVRIQA